MFLLVVAVVCFNFFLFRLPTLVLGASPVDLMISEELRRNLTRDALEQLYLRFGLVPDPVLDDLSIIIKLKDNQWFFFVVVAMLA